MTNKLISRLLLTMTTSAILIVSLIALPVGAFTDKTSRMKNNIVFWNPNDQNCVSLSTASILTGKYTKDYTGTRDILTEAQIQAINAQKTVYQQAADGAGIPWEMIAVIHLRETSLRLENPTNRQGLYQNTSADINDPIYAPGAVTHEMFVEQTKWAANFIKSKARNPAKLVSKDKKEIKDTFFGYNGRASAYATQATALGFTDAFEGSPYVMNMADEARDPIKNPGGWGQIKTDGGAISYPANNDYGAYVVYAALAGVSEDCSGTDYNKIQEKIAAVAEAEYALWQDNTIKPLSQTVDGGASFKKYTEGVESDWCAYFASWVLSQAGSPVGDTLDSSWPAVSQFNTNSLSGSKYERHPNDGSYTPQRGDLALYGAASGYTHMNIVIGVEDGDVVAIGGNEAAVSGGGWSTSRVNKTYGYANGADVYITVK